MNKNQPARVVCFGCACKKEKQNTTMSLALRRDRAEQIRKTLGKPSTTNTTREAHFFFGKTNTSYQLCLGLLFLEETNEQHCFVAFCLDLHVCTSVGPLRDTMSKCATSTKQVFLAHLQGQREGRSWVLWCCGPVVGLLSGVGLGWI